MASSHALWRVIIFLTGSRSDCTRGVHDILQYRVVNVSSSLLNTLKNTNFRLFSSYHLNAHFLYSITIYMLNHNPQHVSSSILLIFRRTNCIITASGIVTLCKVPYSTPVESGLQSALNRHTVRLFTRSDNTRCCYNKFFPPEDERSTDRNMLRIMI